MITPLLCHALPSCSRLQASSRALKARFCIRLIYMRLQLTSPTKKVLKSKTHNFCAESHSLRHGLGRIWGWILWTTTLLTLSLSHDLPARKSNSFMGERWCQEQTHHTLPWPNSSFILELAWSHWTEESIYMMTIGQWKGVKPYAAQDRH